jgi:AhpD family alkylhydroperoxidase
MADDVQVVNRRLDVSENEALIGMARMGADAFGYRADLRIDRHLAELLRLRVSQLNNCTYCLNLHYEAAREAGIPRAKIDTLTAWWETELHSEADQAALRYTEALTRAADTDRDAAFQRFHDALAENFSPEEILEIVGVVVNMNVWTRIKLAEGRDAGPPATLISRAAIREPPRKQFEQRPQATPDPCPTLGATQSGADAAPSPPCSRRAVCHPVMPGRSATSWPSRSPGRGADRTGRGLRAPGRAAACRASIRRA